MKIIETKWDHDILGVKSVEVRCDANDSQHSLTITLKELADSYDYIVVKVPVLQNQLIRKLPDLEFNFVETMFSVEKSLKNHTVDSRLVEKCVSLITREANFEETDYVRNHIIEGIFSTDRISLDEKFGPLLAAKRYWNWIQSEKELGASLFFVSLPNATPLGFFTLRVSNENVAYSVLSGVFDPQRTPGFGLVLLSLILLRAEENGAKKIVSAISSNNLPVVRTHTQLGFEIKDISYVFTQHVNRKQENNYE